MTTEDVEDVIERFFAAVVAGDRATLDDLYADHVEVWHSATGVTVDKATSLAILDWLKGPGVSLTYEVAEQLVVGPRMSRRHVVEIDVPGHPPVRIPASIYLTVEAGQITAIHEYTDARLTDELIAIIPPRA